MSALRDECQFLLVLMRVLVMKRIAYYFYREMKVFECCKISSTYQFGGNINRMQFCSKLYNSTHQVIGLKYFCYIIAYTMTSIV